MTLWRISRHPLLDGAGGLRASARWHTQARPIVYCAPNPATTLLEVLVHGNIDLEDMPAALRYLEIEAPDLLDTEDVNAASMGQSWRADLQATRGIGDHWLQSARTPLLLVPSVIVPATWNVLINPRHPESGQVRVVRTHSHGPDPRLLG